jgi:hypothetical protein
LAYLLRKSKNCDKEESGIFGLMTAGKREVHFFGKGYCKKCTGMKQQRKEEQKRVP